LAQFFALDQFIGSDEHYAAAFALAANRLGFPARVVFGARIGADGVVKGKDVTAWVELHLTAGWVALDPDLYIPDRQQHPEDTLPERKSDDTALEVPPPNPMSLPSGADDRLATQANATKADQPPASILTDIPVGVVYTLAAGGSLLLLLAAVAGAKSWRRSRRRKRGSPARQVAAGWSDTLDRVRDLGLKVPVGLTHREQAAAIGLAAALPLAERTDRVLFGPEEPDPSTAAAYWQQVARTRHDLSRTRSPWRRLWALVNPRSLAPLRPPPVQNGGRKARAASPGRSRSVRAAAKPTTPAAKPTVRAAAKPAVRAAARPGSSALGPAGRASRAPDGAPEDGARP
ncbi:MAG: transglutaminase domain-containing protein, partial [Propionibacteriaceae bacterium]|nr:transglutaminase domain-containing protein [Propionibacteriaceae bacterium]